jgi:osmotically-inducible protein OsmY
MTKSDYQLQRDVIDALRWDDDVGRVEIAVAADNGVVTLAGQVDAFSKKGAAIKAAQRVAGVRVIAEEIRVHPPSIAERTSLDLAHTLLHALEWRAAVPLDRLSVTVNSGWVWLEGTFEHETQREEAEAAVRRIPEVRGVTNLIAVEAGAGISVPEVRHRIENALAHHAAADARQIQIDAAQGTVTLRGSVGSWVEREEVESAVEGTPGVKAVNDLLGIHL